MPRILYQPDKLVAQCDECGTTIEYTHEEWKNDVHLYCPTCGSYKCLDLISDPPEMVKIKLKCSHCGSYLGKGDKYCHQCGATE